MWVDWWNDRSLQQNAVVHDRCITLTFCLKTTLHNNLFLKSYKTHCALVPNIRQLNHKVIEKPILPVRHWQTSVWDFAMKWYRAASSFAVTVIEWKQHQNFTRVQNALKFQEHTSQYSGDYVALQCEKQYSGLAFGCACAVAPGGCLSYMNLKNFFLTFFLYAMT